MNSSLPQKYRFDTKVPWLGAMPSLKERRAQPSMRDRCGHVQKPDAAEWKSASSTLAVEKWQQAATLFLRRAAVTPDNWDCATIERDHNDSLHCRPRKFVDDLYRSWHSDGLDTRPNGRSHDVKTSPDSNSDDSNPEAWSFVVNCGSGIHVQEFNRI